MAVNALNFALNEENLGEVSQISLEPSFDFLSGEYEALFAASDATAFQSPEWLHTFFTTLVPALNVDVLIITLRDRETADLKLVLPLVRQNAMGAKLVQPADLGVSDYNTVIATPDFLTRLETDRDLCAELVRKIGPFDALFLRKQRADGYCMSRLFRKSVVTPNENSAYDVVIDTDFETWMSNAVSKQFRKSIRSKRRRFEDQIGPLKFNHATTAAEIDDAFAFMRRTRAARFPGDLFCDDDYFAFYRAFAGLTAANGRSFVFVGKVEDRIVAVEFGLVHDGTSYLVHGAFDMDFSAYSPGNLSLVDLIQFQLRSGLSKFDFTIGDHGYKTRLNARKTMLYNAVLSNGPRGKLVSAIYRNGGGIKKLLTKLNPKVN